MEEPKLYFFEYEDQDGIVQEGAIKAYSAADAIVQAGFNPEVKKLIGVGPPREQKRELLKG